MHSRRGVFGPIKNSGTSFPGDAQSPAALLIMVENLVSRKSTHLEIHGMIFIRPWVLQLSACIVGCSTDCDVSSEQMLATPCIDRLQGYFGRV
jgi:hypothetical protein